jgi:hypothetical protein
MLSSKLDPPPPRPSTIHIPVPSLDFLPYVWQAKALPILATGRGGSHKSHQ